MALGTGDGFWNNVIVIVIAAITGAATMIGLVWKFIAQVGRMDIDIKNQRKDFDESLIDVDRLSQSVGKLHEEHFRLREMLASQPTKQDMIGLETRLGTQLDRIVQRIDTLAAK